LAIAELQQAIEQDPRYGSAYGRLAQAYIRRYVGKRDPIDLELARRNADLALKYGGSNPEVHVACATMFSIVGQSRDAFNELEQALKLDPGNTEALLLKARTLTEMNRPSEAEATFSRVISLRPNFAQAYNLFGEFYYNRADYPNAERMLHLAIACTPRFERAYSNLGGVYLATKRYDEADACFRKAIEIHPSAIAYSNAGTQMFLREQYARAVPLMEKAVEIDPRTHTLWRNLGDTYAMVPALQPKAAGAWQRAAETALAELRVRPSDANLLTSLALYHAHLRHQGQALDYLEQARTILNTDVNVAFKRAQALALLGRTSEALTAVEALWRRGFSMDQIVKAPELNSLRHTARYNKILADIHNSQATTQKGN